MSFLQKYVLKTKDINVNVFNMVKNKNEAKNMSTDCKCKFNQATSNSNQKMKH